MLFFFRAVLFCLGTGPVTGQYLVQEPANFKVPQVNSGSEGQLGLTYKNKEEINVKICPYDECRLLECHAV
jgi:hypothetical protein